jgi:hypothetical protein
MSSHLRIKKAPEEIKKQVDHMKIDIASFFINRIVKSMYISSYPGAKKLQDERIGGTSTTGGLTGVNRSYILEFENGTRGIFKNRDGEHISTWRYIPPHTLYKREVAAYELDQMLGWNLVPATAMITHKNEVGSVQAWQEDATASRPIKYYSDEDIWKAGLLDLLICNSDRHCLTGDTAIKLLDGTYATMEELSHRTEPYWVYGVDDKLNIVPSLATPAFVSGENAPVYKVVLDNGEEIKATSNHRFMMRDGSYVEAKNLNAGDSLMPLYHKYNDKGNALLGYELVLQPKDNRWHFTHCLIAGKVKRGEIRHHVDLNKLNNCPDNLNVISKSDHILIHFPWARTNEERFGVEVAAIIKEKKRNKALNRKHSEHTKEIIGAQKRGKTFEEMYGIERAQEIKDKIARAGMGKIPHNKDKKYEDYMSLEDSNALKDRRNAKNREVRFGKSMEEFYGEEKAKEVKEKIAADKRGRTWAERLGEEGARIAKERLSATLRKNHQLGIQKNHKVVSIEYIGIADKVYDISTSTHNFGLSSGVFVHNSGNFLTSPEGKVICIDNGYAWSNKAASGDPKSVILSRFSFAIWDRPIPHRLYDDMRKLNSYELHSVIETLIDKEAFDLFLERLNYMLKTKKASFPKYRIVKRLDMRGGNLLASMEKFMKALIPKKVLVHGGPKQGDYYADRYTSTDQEEAPEEKPKQEEPEAPKEDRAPGAMYDIAKKEFVDAIFITDKEEMKNTPKDKMEPWVVAQFDRDMYDEEEELVVGRMSVKNFGIWNLLSEIYYKDNDVYKTNYRYDRHKYLEKDNKHPIMMKDDDGNIQGMAYWIQKRPLLAELAYGEIAPWNWGRTTWRKADQQNLLSPDFLDAIDPDVAVKNYRSKGPRVKGANLALLKRTLEDVHSSDTTEFVELHAWNEVVPLYDRIGLKKFRQGDSNSYRFKKEDIPDIVNNLDNMYHSRVEKEDKDIPLTWKDIIEDEEDCGIVFGDPDKKEEDEDIEKAVTEQTYTGSSSASSGLMRRRVLIHGGPRQGDYWADRYFSTGEEVAPEKGSGEGAKKEKPKKVPHAYLIKDDGSVDKAEILKDNDLFESVSYDALEEWDVGMPNSSEARYGIFDMPRKIVAYKSGVAEFKENDRYHYLGLVGEDGRLQGLTLYKYDEGSRTGEISYLENAPWNLPDYAWEEYLFMDKLDYPKEWKRKHTGISALSMGVNDLYKAGAEKVWLHPLTNAIPFYEKMGFETIQDPRDPSVEWMELPTREHIKDFLIDVVEKYREPYKNLTKMRDLTLEQLEELEEKYGVLAGTIKEEKPIKKQHLRIKKEKEVISKAEKLPRLRMKKAPSLSSYIDSSNDPSAPTSSGQNAPHPGLVPKKVRIRGKNGYYYAIRYFRTGEESESEDSGSEEVQSLENVEWPNIEDIDIETKKIDSLAKIFGYGTQDERRQNKELVVNNLINFMAANHPDFSDFSRDCLREICELREDFSDIYNDQKYRGSGKSDEWKMINIFIKSWAVSSGDSFPLALAIQKAAREAFDLQDSSPSELNAINTKNVAKANEIYNKWGKHFKDFVSSVYEITQKYFEDKGIKEVTLYRGSARAFYDENLDEDNFYDVYSTNANIGEASWRTESGRLQPLSSFSFHPNVAMDFGLNKPSTDILRVMMRESEEARRMVDNINHFPSYEGERPEEVIYTDTGRELMRHIGWNSRVRIGSFPVSRIWSTPKTGPGCTSEQEMVVLGGKDDFLSRNIKFNNSSNPSPAEVPSSNHPQGYQGIIFGDSMRNTLYYTARTQEMLEEFPRVV